MPLTAAEVAELERANYLAVEPAMRVTPGLELLVRDDIILTGSRAFRTPDANHACRLRAEPGAVERLIDEAVAFFREREVPATIFVSPACAPPDLGDRLLARGFVRNPVDECWLMMDGLLRREIPEPRPGLRVTRATRADALTFASVFSASFDLPSEWTPFVAQLLEPSMDLPSVCRYLAWDGDTAVGTLALTYSDRLCIIGAGGVLPGYRGSHAAFNLVVTGARDMARRGLDLMIGQTVAGQRFERFMRISGFRVAFRREGYTLHDGAG